MPCRLRPQSAVAMFPDAMDHEPQTTASTRILAAALLAGVPAAAQARAYETGVVVLAVVSCIGFVFAVKTLFAPWFATRSGRRSASWPLGLALAFGAVALSAVLVAVVGPDTPGWRVSAIAWNALVLATLGTGVAVVCGLVLHGRDGALPRVQQGLAIAWLVLVPLTTQWDRLTRHHHVEPPGADDVRSVQLRALTAAEAGPRLADRRPAAGQCTLRVSRSGDEAPWLMALYGRDTGAPQDRLTAPAAWRGRGATLIGLADGTLGLQDNGGLVRRNGLNWQLDVGRPWSWSQVEAAHAAYLTEAARRAELAGREAAWRAADKQLQLIGHTVPDPHAESPLRLQPESAFDRLEAPVPARALADAGLVCTRSMTASSGWQCTDTRAAWICPVVHLSSLCEVPGRRLAGTVINLQAGVPAGDTGSDTSWFLFRANPPACVLLSRRLSDAAVRARSGDGLVTCDTTGTDPTRPVPTLVAHLPMPTESDRSHLADRVRDLRSVLDDAARAVQPPAATPLPYRVNAITRGELDCDATAGPCRRFAAELVSDGTPIEIAERCSDGTTAAAHSRFTDPLFKP